MQTVVHRAETRGGGDHGWLRTAHSFSFADWYDAGRMGFGALRVLNDDRIAPHQGFGMHSHDNFEIITIVMSGAVTHEDDGEDRRHPGQNAADKLEVPVGAQLLLDLVKQIDQSGLRARPVKGGRNLSSGASRCNAAFGPLTRSLQGLSWRALRRLAEI